MKLAAIRGTYGLKGTADLLDERLGLHWPGRRTAHPRHQTLHALLAWSYGLLAETEQRALRRLSAFVGPFTLEAARAVAADTELDEAQRGGAIDNLIAKSLLSTIETTQGATTYRLGQREFEKCLHEPFDPLHRVADADIPCDPFPGRQALLHQGIQQRVLVGKVIVHRHRGHPRALGNLADGEPRYPVPFEYGLCGSEDAVFRHMYTVRPATYDVHTFVVQAEARNRYPLYFRDHSPPHFHIITRSDKPKPSIIA